MTTRKPATPAARRRAGAGRRLPGDPSPGAAVARILRVDQAGEYGAARIYDGQLAILGRRPVGATIREMRAQEARHLETFDRLVADRRVRPTALAPLWHVAGFALGAATALLGERAARACTVAVEEAIDAHYARQAGSLDEDEAPLRQTIEAFRADELAHRDTGLAHGAERAPGYRALHAVVGTATRLAIRLSERY